MCDGEKMCLDGSDESETFCQGLWSSIWPKLRQKLHHDRFWINLMGPTENFAVFWNKSENLDLELWAVKPWKHLFAKI